MCAVDYWVEKRWKWSRGRRWNGEKVEDCVPRTSGDTESHDERAVEPNATAPSIYRGVTYTNTTDQEGEIKPCSLPQTQQQQR